MLRGRRDSPPIKSPWKMFEATAQPHQPNLPWKGGGGGKGEGVGVTEGGEKPPPPAKLPVSAAMKHKHMHAMSAGMAHALLQHRQRGSKRRVWGRRTAAEYIYSSRAGREKEAGVCRP